MKTKFLVSRKTDERIKYIKKIKGKKAIIYSDKSDSKIVKMFDLSYNISSLFKDAIFLDSLAKIDGNTTLVLLDVVENVSSVSGNYIKEYNKLHPLSLQSKECLIVDYFLFYFIENAIYRPFLYIDPNIVGSTVKEFYNVGIYADYKGSKIEVYYKKIKPFVKVMTKPIEIITLKYTPTKKEIEGYEKLKKQIIFDLKYPKIKVVRILIDYVDNLKSKNDMLKAHKKEVILINSNKTSMRSGVYKHITQDNVKSLFFTSSGIFGADEIELNKTRGAIERHNDLIKLLNG